MMDSICRKCLFRDYGDLIWIGALSIEMTGKEKWQCLVSRSISLYWIYLSPAQVTCPSQSPIILNQIKINEQGNWISFITTNHRLWDVPFWVIYCQFLLFLVDNAALQERNVPKGGEPLWWCSLFSRLFLPMQRLALQSAKKIQPPHVKVRQVIKE